MELIFTPKNFAWLQNKKTLCRGGISTPGTAATSSQRVLQNPGLSVPTPTVRDRPRITCSDDDECKDTALKIWGGLVAQQLFDAD